jgi:hypothetical protein
LGNLHEWQVFLETFELTFELFGQGGAHGGDVACAALEQLGNALQVCPVCGVVGGGGVGGGGRGGVGWRVAVGPGQLEGFFVFLGRVVLRFSKICAFVLRFVQ